MLRIQNPAWLSLSKPFSSSSTGATGKGRASTSSAKPGWGAAFFLFLTAPAFAASPLAGDYDGSRAEIAAALQLLPNGNFRYFLSYGALDEQAAGQWVEKDGKVLLTSRPTPKAPAFDIVSDKVSADGKLHVALDNPDALGGFSLTVRLIYPGRDKPTFVEADEDGVVTLPPGPPPAAIVPDLPVFDTPIVPYSLKGAGRALVFHFAPNDLGIADFRDEPLAVENGELLLRRYDTAIRFRKAQQ
ncbi:MAG: hypothetical protein JSS55_16865 [Proteobacteria bacterium]|nr:hypothetical protein [Pseudomonadota bacterium]